MMVSFVPVEIEMDRDYPVICVSDFVVVAVAVVVVEAVVVADPLLL